MLVDEQALAQFGAGLTAGIAALQEEIWGPGGEEFNLNSTQHWAGFSLSSWACPGEKRPRQGTPPAPRWRNSPHHPIIDLILEYRQLTKLNSTYVEGLSKVIAGDGRIHTCFQKHRHRHWTAVPPRNPTSRISLCAPSWGRRFWKMFIARPGWVLVDADYSQIELRLLAHMAGDEKMIESFRSGRISTPARPLRSLACRWRRSPGNCAAGPRR